MPCFAISSNTGISLNKSVTPESELVGCACWIEFESHNTGSLGLTHEFGSGIVGQIKRHQRLEGAAFWQGGQNALFVCLGIGNADDGRASGLGMITARPICRAVYGGNGFERVAVAQV